MVMNPHPAAADNLDRAQAELDNPDFGDTELAAALILMDIAKTLRRINASLLVRTP